MKDIFQALPITEKIYWVGAIDWNLRDFHGYATRRGSTYNAYLILGPKIALIDTVKAPFKEEMFARIASVTSIDKIDYIISGHAEMDHSGSLPDIIALTKPQKVLASKMGVEALKAHFGPHLNLTEVKDGESLSLGDLNLTFIETRMLHWPDSMFTYLNEGNILFSQDAFGMHLASSQRFDGEIPEAVLEEEARRYYANILLPLSSRVAKLLETVHKSNLKINMILPAHGPVWRWNPYKIIELYQRWSEGRPADKALIVYDTMWGSTAKMAQAIAEGLKASGLNYKMVKISAIHRSDVAEEILEAGALIVGSPTLNANLLPTMADVLSYLEGLKRPNLVGAIFGSCGWANKAGEIIQEYLNRMKVELVAPPLSVKYVPDEQALKDCYNLGKLVAEKLKAKLVSF